MNEPTLRVLNLGAGVQSSTVLLMSATGLLPKLDAAVFADTGWEPEQVYQNKAWLTEMGGEAGIPVYTVKKGDLRQDALVNQVRGKRAESHRWASMPLRTRNPDGSIGMIKRQCTTEYKVRPIEQFIKRELLGLRPRQRVPKGILVEQWFGISADEVNRIRSTGDHWRDFVYPLCGIPKQMLAKPYRRADCERWLKAGYPGREVPRSACIGCPFHTNAEWRRIKTNRKEWEDAVAFDEAIRRCGGMRGELFLHRGVVALSQADLRTAAEHGQLDLWQEECLGVCGV